MSADTSLITFKAIADFTTCLGEVFTQRSLKLYVHLITKTTLAHHEPIQKHINAFRKFCRANRDAIAEKNAAKLVEKSITYSQRVFINMELIFKQADVDTAKVIWTHLLTISALVDPTGKARQILKDTSDTGQNTEADFLSNIIGKVEEHVDPNANPMEAVASIMSSGIFTDLVGGMGNGLQDGSLDLGKLMGTVQTMVSGLSAQAGGDSEAGEPLELINTMMGSLSAGANSEGVPQGAPNLSGMLNMMGPLIGGLANAGGGGLGGGGTIEEQIEAQVAASREAGDLPAIKETAQE